MPRAIDRLVGPPGAQHIDAYQEYSNLVGRLDGGSLLSDAAYQALRQRAANPNRRLYVYWRNKATGLDCKAIGPQTLCFCQHRYNEHDWEAFDTRQVRCKMPGCGCTCFDYIPVRGSQDLQCSTCHRSFREHRARDHGCPKSGGATSFTSSYNCSCRDPYCEHSTVFESRTERERAGRPVDTGWMEQASREGLPVCHLGGITGFTSLADGVDRMLAGLESDEVSDSVANRGPVMGDAGANRFMQRLQVEDEVNTASIVDGRAAGLRAIAKAQAKRNSAAPGRASGRLALAPASGGAPARRAGSVSFPLGGPGSATSSASAPRANVHSLAGPVAISGNATSSHVDGAAAAPEGRRISRGGTAPKAAAAKRAATLPPGGRSAAGSGSGAAAGGRRLGGARHNDPTAMREARLARFEG